MERVWKEFGFGQLTKIDILEENSGLIPSTEYYNAFTEKESGRRGTWSAWESARRGWSDTSPDGKLRFNAWQQGTLFSASYRANNLQQGTNTTDTVAVEHHDLHVSEHTWQLVREGMRRAVMEPGGTGGAARIPGLVVAGKTGTAENPHGKAHSWFIAFAPFDHPKIAICVLVENVGYGGSFAAPIAGLCMEKYLYGEIVPKRKALADQDQKLSKEQQRSTTTAAR